MRGNLLLCVPQCRLESGTITVYPRACGGTSLDQSGLFCFVVALGLSPRVRGNHALRVLNWLLPSRSGLSPRVRGNPVDWSVILLIVGSIPARAGEPAAVSL